MRKQRQVEAFAHIARSLVPGGCIVDAASGAGNLAIGMAGIMGPHYSFLAIDVNPRALWQLEQRVANESVSIGTVCSDLMDPSLELPPEASMVCSLHGCGAVSDVALQLAVAANLPFCISPCCTAKAVVRRTPGLDSLASMQRSAAPSEIVYPRSKWLRSQGVHEDDYERLAAIADVGLGPQTPDDQRQHQQRAKWTIELDRLQAVPDYYAVGLVRLRDHEDYGKQEVLVGAPRAGLASFVAYFANRTG